MSRQPEVKAEPTALHVLVVAPSAPPKNSPEAMQVGRFLATADSAVRFTLVTTSVVAGWQQADASLTLKRPGMRTLLSDLPMHRFSQRVLGSQRLRQLHVPDSYFWLPWFARRVSLGLEQKPDVIYSRSVPFSAALLARRLKALLGLPWMMHLSDPWADSPYRRLSDQQAAVDRQLEAACFREADRISLTTEGQADHYRAVFAGRARDIVVTPNMMPEKLSPVADSGRGRGGRTGPLRLAHTGAMYGAREPSAILAAMRRIHDRLPRIREQVMIDFYGNMPRTFAAAIDAAPGCTWHGPVPFPVALAAQAAADVVLTIEGDGPDPLLRHFMPSKNLDYMAQGKPILALTPFDSETAQLCAAGHGWSVAPHDEDAIVERIVTLVGLKARGAPLLVPPNLGQSPFRAQTVTAAIVAQLAALATNGTRPGQRAE